MKKIAFFIAGLFLFLTACSSSNDNTNIPPVVAQTFTHDNQTFNLLTTQGGISEGRMTDVFTLNGIHYNRSTITIVGLSGGFSQTATVSFDLYYRDGMSVAGTYNIYDADDDTSNFEDYLTPLERGCMGWTSAGVIFNTTSSVETSSNNPSGTIKIIANSPTNYTIQYNGNFRLYGDTLAFIRNVPSVINVTGAVLLEN